MSEAVYDLIIIGAGPGGYVASIRAAQLGMKVAVVEKREALGGVCLNEGCIPSKALLDSSEYFALARDRFAGHGIEIAPPTLNLARMMGRKDEVVKKLTDGVAFLFKKNGIDRVTGFGRLAGPAVGVALQNVYPVRRRLGASEERRQHFDDPLLTIDILLQLVDFHLRHHTILVLGFAYLIDSHKLMVRNLQAVLDGANLALQ